MLDPILSKIDRTASEVKGLFPHITEQGRWRTTTDGYWTGGYWIGLLWSAYTATKHEKYLKWAREWAVLLEPRKNDKNPDLGHLFYPSFVKGYEITRDEKMKKIALDAANTLTSCFNVSTGFLHNEVEVGGKKAGRAIIDFMAILPLLWWAHGETGDEKYHDVAQRHSMSTIENLVRNDGSTIHVVDFDLKTGRIIRKTTVQGHDENSCWSRGQAWGIYGFAEAYGATEEKLFLSIAGKLANYFVKNLPSDHVPYWDFNDPRIPDAPKDSSAAAIACSGLITLSKLSGNKRFGNVAGKILRSLSTNYVAEENRDGILKHGSFHVPKKNGVDEGLIWGDYYFMGALMKSSGVPQDNNKLKLA